MLIFSNLYLAFSIFLSPLGLRKLNRIKQSASYLKNQLNDLESINLEINQKIQHLESKNVDKEFLDEVLKKHIFYSDNTERLIITDDEI